MIDNKTRFPIVFRGLQNASFVTEPSRHCFETFSLMCNPEFETEFIFFRFLLVQTRIRLTNREERFIQYKPFLRMTRTLSQLKN